MKPIFPFSSRPLTAAILALSLSGAVAPQAILAQPTPQQEQVEEQRAMEAMKKDAVALGKTDPKGAAALIADFVQEHPRLNPEARFNLLTYTQVTLLEQSKQSAAAVQLLDALIKEARARLEQGAPAEFLVRPQSVKVRVLSAAKIYPAAAQVFAGAADWQRVVDLLAAPGALRVSIGNAALGVHLDALRNNDQQDVASEKILALFDSEPLLLTGRYRTQKFDLVPRLVTILLAQKKNEAALSWAKVAYLLAPFDNASIEQSNKLLAQSWGIDNFATLRAFTRAQEAALDSEDAKKNPLFAVPLPPQVLAMQDELRARATKLASTSATRHDAVSLFLLSEDWHAAMQTALAMWRDDPANNAGIGEINRVFKATDLSPVSGNAFIAFLDDAKGDNPVKTFLDAHPPLAAKTQ